MKLTVLVFDNFFKFIFHRVLFQSLLKYHHIYISFFHGGKTHTLFTEVYSRFYIQFAICLRQSEHKQTLEVKVRGI